MKTKINFLLAICALVTAFAGHAQNLVENLSGDEVTIVFKNANDQSVSKAEHKQSGRMIHYDPGKSITIVTSKGDTLTYQQSEIYRIQRKRPYNMAFTSEFGEGGPRHGYIGEYNFELGVTTHTPIGFSTVQGYQFLPWLRVGAGYQFMRMKGLQKLNEEGKLVPATAYFNAIFGDAKVFFTRSLFNPFVDVRLGAMLDYGGSFFYDASIGCRFGFRSSKRLAFNFAFGLANAKFIITNADRRAALLIRAGFEF